MVSFNLGSAYKYYLHSNRARHVFPMCSQFFRQERTVLYNCIAKINVTRRDGSVDFYDWQDLTKIFYTIDMAKNANCKGLEI